jgi:transposase
MANTGLYTLQRMAQAVGRARSVVQQWLDKFDQGGIDAMLERKKPTGRKPRIAEKICVQIDEHLQQGTWRSAGEMQRWRKETHQIEMGLGGCYYWLGKRGNRHKKSSSCSATTGYVREQKNG